MRELSGIRTAVGALSLIGIIAVVPSATAITGTLATATDGFSCGSPSSLRERLGAHYTDFDAPLPGTRLYPRGDVPSDLHVRPPTADLARLATLERTLSAARPRAGSGYRIECRGASRGEPYPVVWRFDLEQIERVETLSGETLLTAFEDRYDVVAPVDEHRVDDVLVAEVMTVPDAAAWRIVDDGDGLRATQRARRRGAALQPNCLSPVEVEVEVEVDAEASALPCAYLIEIEWTLTAAGPDLELAQTFFTNGLASERAVWRLSL